MGWYRIIVQERETARAARGAKAWIHGGIMVQIPTPQLLFVHLSRPHIFQLPSGQIRARTPVLGEEKGTGSV